MRRLVEEGHDVAAVETWDEAELLLRKRAVTPALVVFDLEEEDHPAAALATLARLLDPARVLVLTAPSTFPVAEVRALGLEHVLARPYSVGDVVNATRTLVRGATRANR